MSDNVNHPSHYETGNFECIDVMLETQGLDAVKAFCICNAFKYIYRHNGKNGDEDIRKAKWYIDKYVELVDKQEDKADYDFETRTFDGTPVFVKEAEKEDIVSCMSCKYVSSASDICINCENYCNWEIKDEG